MLCTPIKGTSRIENPHTPIPKPSISEIMADFAPGLCFISSFSPSMMGTAVLSMLYGTPNDKEQIAIASAI